MRKNINRFRSEPMGQGTTMKGIVFDHLRKDNVVQEEWDGICDCCAGISRSGSQLHQCVLAPVRR